MQISASPVSGTAPAGSPGAVLVRAGELRAAAEAAERELLRVAVEWADLHPVLEDPGPETFVTRTGDTGVTIAGEGAPQLAWGAADEFAVVLGLGPEAGKRYLGDAIELCHRLPRTWARVMAGAAPAWKARLVAQATRALSAEAAAYVDAQVHWLVGRVRPWQLARLVEEAIARFMPETVRARAVAAAERRHVTVDSEQVSFDGTVRLLAELDLADAYDFETAVAAGADQLARAGSPESLDARRACAVGELARTQLALLFDDPGHPAPGHPAPGQPDPGQSGSDPAGVLPRPWRRGRRRLMLYVHLHESALTGAGGVARVASAGDLPVTVDQVRDWCGRPDAHVVLTPVRDLAEHLPVHAYEVPDRLAEQVALRDHACVFPFCTRPAHPSRVDQHRCDCDHILPHGRGGLTCACNLAALCRHHHRLKTHTPWRYTSIEPGLYLWRSPHGWWFLRDHTGTTPLDPHHPTLGRALHPDHHAHPGVTPIRAPDQ